MLFNILSFTPATEAVSVNLYVEKVEKTHPNIVFRDECPALWKQHANTISKCRHLYCSFANETFAISKGKKDYPFPIKVKISSANKTFQVDNSLIAELLD